MFFKMCHVNWISPGFHFYITFCKVTILFHTWRSCQSVSFEWLCTKMTTRWLRLSRDCRKKKGLFNCNQTVLVFGYHGFLRVAAVLWWIMCFPWKLNQHLKSNWGIIFFFFASFSFFVCCHWPVWFKARTSLAHVPPKIGWDLPGCPLALHLQTHRQYVRCCVGEVVIPGIWGETTDRWPRCIDRSVKTASFHTRTVG